MEWISRTQNPYDKRVRHKNQRFAQRTFVHVCLFITSEHCKGVKTANREAETPERSDLEGRPKETKSFFSEPTVFSWVDFFSLLRLDFHSSYSPALRRPAVPFRSEIHHVISYHLVFDSPVEMHKRRFFLYIPLSANIGAKPTTTSLFHPRREVCTSCLEDILCFRRCLFYGCRIWASISPAHLSFHSLGLFRFFFAQAPAHAL